MLDLSRSFAALLLLGLMSTSSWAQKTDPGSSGRRIAVVVLAGHHLKLQQMGFMVFGNQFGKVSARGDELAQALHDGVGRELEMEQRYQVSRFPVGANLARLAAKAYDGSNGFWTASIDDLQADVDRWRTACDCDDLLIVSEYRGDIPMTNQVLSGLTLFRRVGGLDEHARVAAPLALYRVEAATGRLVARGRTFAAHMARSRLDWPFAKADDVAALEDPTWHEVLRGLRETLAEVLPGALDQVGLRPSCTRFFYDWTHSPQQRDPSHANHVPPPVVPPGADPGRCSAPGASVWKPNA